MSDTSSTTTASPTLVAAPERLRDFIARLERLQEERERVAEDTKEVFAEVRAAGFDLPTVREVLRLRRKDPGERAEHEALLDVYLHALGMLNT